MLNNLTNHELIREAESRNNDDLLILTLCNRLEEKGGDVVTIQGSTDKDYTAACVSHIHDFAGEDFHSDIIAEISKLIEIKTMVERKKQVQYITERLYNVDKQACDLITCIQMDGVIM